MTQPQIISEKAIDVYQVKEELDTIEARDGELSFRSQKTKEYIESVSQFDVKKAAEIRDSIIALEIPRFKEEYIAKILDVNPVSVDDLKQLVATFGVTVKDENLKQIIDLLQN